MPDAADPWPWAAAWRQAEQALRTEATAASPAGTEALRQLLDFGGIYAAFARGAWPLLDQPRMPGQAFVDQYQRLFAPAPTLAGPATPAGASAEWLRWQTAWQRMTQQAAAIAVDASRRLADALARSGPDVPPITSLRELHDLWVECGEAAYAEAAHGEEFAAAQAELLQAAVELQCRQQAAGR